MIQKDIVQYYQKNVYGKTLSYYYDDEFAAIMQELTGEKTMTSKTQKALEKLGFAFVELLPPKE